MKEKNDWSEINSNLSEIKDKIRNSINEDDLTSDLKDSLKNTAALASETLSELKNNIEKTVTDEEIKKDAKNLISKIVSELEENLYELTSKVSNYFEHKSSDEEE